MVFALHLSTYRTCGMKYKALMQGEGTTHRHTPHHASNIFFFPSESCNLVILLPGHERFLKSHLFCMLCFGYNPFEASTTVLHVSVLRVTAGSCSMTWALGFCSTIITQICRVYKHMVTHTQGKPRMSLLWWQKWRYMSLV